MIPGRPGCRSWNATSKGRLALFTGGPASLSPSATDGCRSACDKPVCTRSARGPRGASATRRRAGERVTSVRSPETDGVSPEVTAIRRGRLHDAVLRREGSDAPTLDTQSSRNRPEPASAARPPGVAGVPSPGEGRASASRSSARRGRATRRSQVIDGVPRLQVRAASGDRPGRCPTCRVRLLLAAHGSAVADSVAAGRLHVSSRPATRRTPTGSWPGCGGRAGSASSTTSTTSTPRSSAPASASRAVCVPGCSTAS